MLVVLLAVAVISAAFLGYVHTATRDRIELNRTENIRAAVYEVLPRIDDYKKINEDPLIFEGYSGGESAGYAVVAGGMGFQGEITLMVGIESDLSRFTGMKVLESVETPGLGDRIKEAEFRAQFERKPISQDGTIEINALTGATISSKAVEKIIIKAIKDAKRIH
ncbi:MAG: FMN-binding protein [Elusimicrobiota bacterium]|nr:FMN-binding protein [Elusimicrobiota bacterium]